jgi:hypothetical protein
MTYIKMKWDAVFSAAITKQLEIEKYQAEWHEKRITRLMDCTVGFLWNKRKRTREEAEQLHQECIGEVYLVPRMRSLQRAKELAEVALRASKQYDDNNDYVYLDKDDVIFLFGV